MKDGGEVKSPVEHGTHTHKSLHEAHSNSRALRSGIEKNFSVLQWNIVKCSYKVGKMPKRVRIPSSTSSLLQGGDSLAL